MFYVNYVDLPWQGKGHKGIFSLSNGSPFGVVILHQQKSERQQHVSDRAEGFLQIHGRKGKKTRKGKKKQQEVNSYDRLLLNNSKCYCVNAQQNKHDLMKSRRLPLCRAKVHSTSFPARRTL